MRCRRLQPFLLAWLEDDLTQTQRQQVETHITACPACAATLQSMQHALHMVRTTEVPEPDATYWEMFLPTLQQRIHQEEALPPRRRPLRVGLWPSLPRPALAALAASLLLIGALPFLRGAWKQPSRPAVVLSGVEDAALTADLDLLKNLDLLEDVDVVEETDAAL